MTNKIKYVILINKGVIFILIIIAIIAIIISSIIIIKNNKKQEEEIKYISNKILEIYLELFENMDISNIDDNKLNNLFSFIDGYYSFSEKELKLRNSIESQLRTEFTDIPHIYAVVEDNMLQSLIIAKHKNKYHVLINLEENAMFIKRK